MAQIVINSCHGGFSLSPLAEKTIAERKGEKVFFYTQTKHKFRDGSDEFVRLELDEISESHFLIYTLKKDFGAVISSITNDNADGFIGRQIERNDPDLVEVVKQLGSAANGSCAELTIVEIPDDVNFTIEEYDGSEWVAEQRRSWR